MEVYNTQPDHAGLQTNLNYTGLQPVPFHGQPQYIPQDTAYAQQKQQQYQAYWAPQPISKICGLRRTTFWLVLLLILVLILAIVGGTVGGVVGSQKASTR